MKNPENYIKQYEENIEVSFKKWAYRYPPKSLEELIDWNKTNFEKYLRQRTENDLKKTQSYIKLFKAARLFGLYLAFQKSDYGLLNNVLYQSTRQDLLDLAMMGSGTDHCHLFPTAVLSFASNDFEIIESFFPGNLRLSKGQFYTENAINLLKVLYYKQTEFKEEALKRAEKFLAKKVTIWEKSIVLYFIALIHRNAGDASSCLQDLCVGLQKSGNADALGMLFAPEIHGLYRLCRIIDEEFFNTLKRPDHFCFSEEFELWQKENNYPRGKLFYNYPPEMNYMNQIFEAQIPVIALYHPYNDKREFKNADKFAEDLHQNVLKVLLSKD